ncbi:holin [Streptomyces sp. NPDC057456]|uniref:holin n=1 Tax=Streptomyces sp. NPDC057456 TaxID=3346139 RepID=UPI0036B9273E
MSRHAIERKVKWSTAEAYLASSGLLGVLGAVQDNTRILSPLPDSISPLVLAVVPALVTLTAGWKADHTPRPDRDG